jgi:hypothetical protein
MLASPPMRERLSSPSLRMSETSRSARKVERASGERAHGVGCRWNSGSSPFGQHEVGFERRLDANEVFAVAETEQPVDRQGLARESLIGQLEARLERVERLVEPIPPGGIAEQPLGLDEQLA